MKGQKARRRKPPSTGRPRLTQEAKVAVRTLVSRLALKVLLQLKSAQQGPTTPLIVGRTEKEAVRRSGRGARHPPIITIWPPEQDSIVAAASITPQIHKEGRHVPTENGKRLRLR